MYQQQKRLDTLAEDYTFIDSWQTRDLLERLSGSRPQTDLGIVAESPVRACKTENYLSSDGSLHIRRELVYVGPKHEIVRDQATITSSDKNKVKYTVTKINEYFAGIPLVFERNGFAERFQFRRDTV
ncbi:hypothetical protein HYV87_00420 [Candidatus Woesearchaeota archaeon]|nr:hypothetical protein [Candidatus Woesearchaeota archaeon]MBI2581577.1 hypothetical protein [Candidatus Woesearchaeota archaeon]